MNEQRVLASGVVLASLVLGVGCGDTGSVVAVPAGPTQDTAAAPPPVSGGTLLLFREARLAVAADPAVDQLFVVDLAEQAVLRTIELVPGDEPGRMVAGTGQEAFVVLRRAGEIARVDLESGVMGRQFVCPAPRGIDYEPASDRLFVACAGGELVTLNGSLELLGMTMLERDLRDVVLLDGGKLAVSLFRSAEVLLIDTLGVEPTVRSRPPNFLSSFLVRNFEPGVAYRMQKLPNGFVAVVHQRALLDAVPMTPPSSPGQSSYGGGGEGNCDQAIVHSAVSLLDPSTQTVITSDIGQLVLPVDIAVSPSGDRFAMVGAGNDQAVEMPTLSGNFAGGCSFSPEGVPISVPGEPVAVAYDAQGRMVVQTQQPAALHLFGLSTVPIVIDLPGPSRRDVGHSLFNHAASSSSLIACASCHAEGREDGRRWQFEELGLRRTQDVSGGVMATMPFHWDGELHDMHSIMTEVFMNRMGGSPLDGDRVASLAAWVDGLQRLPASYVDPAAVERGKLLFQSSETACATCHAGEALTNNTTVDVGTGRPMQVPSLTGLWSRAPYMHDGCAATLRDRFDPTNGCGGRDLHGRTSQLGPEQIGDLIAYLESL